MKKIDFTDKKQKKALKMKLEKNTLRVIFEKSDGTEREMFCTLMENKIPDEKKPKNAKKAKNDDVLPVFDVEKQDWRSFRYDSIKSFSEISKNTA